MRSVLMRAMQPSHPHVSPVAGPLAAGVAALWVAPHLVGLGGLAAVLVLAAAVVWWSQLPAPSSTPLIVDVAFVVRAGAVAVLSGLAGVVVLGPAPAGDATGVGAAVAVAGLGASGVLARRWIGAVGLVVGAVGALVLGRLVAVTPHAAELSWWAIEARPVRSALAPEVAVVAVGLIAAALGRPSTPRTRWPAAAALVVVVASTAGAGAVLGRAALPPVASFVDTLAWSLGDVWLRVAAAAALLVLAAAITSTPAPSAPVRVVTGVLAVGLVLWPAALAPLGVWTFGLAFPLLFLASSLPLRRASQVVVLVGATALVGTSLVLRPLDLVSAALLVASTLAVLAITSMRTWTRP